MLTIEINDTYLENILTKRAGSLGKTTQEFVKDILLSSISELHYKTFNASDHGYIINEPTIKYGQKEETELFSHVDDAAKYTKALRQHSWRKK